MVPGAWHLRLRGIGRISSRRRRRFRRSGLHRGSVYRFLRFIGILRHFRAVAFARERPPVWRPVDAAGFRGIRAGLDAIVDGAYGQRVIVSFHCRIIPNVPGTDAWCQLPVIVHYIDGFSAFRWTELPCQVITASGIALRIEDRGTLCRPPPAHDKYTTPRGHPLLQK